MHNFTVAIEIVSTLSSASLCLALFVLLVLARCCTNAKRRCSCCNDVADPFSWLHPAQAKLPNRVFSIASLALLNAAIFFLSAEYVTEPHLCDLRVEQRCLFAGARKWYPMFATGVHNNKRILQFVVSGTVSTTSRRITRFALRKEWRINSSSRP